MYTIIGDLIRVTRNCCSKLNKMGYKKKSYKDRKMSKKKKEFLSISPGSPTGAVVVDGDVNFAIQRWKRSVKESGLMQEVYKRREFEKPSSKRRRVKLDAEYRNRKSRG